MGSKAESKAIMIQAGVLTTPGYNGESQNDADLLHQTITHIGFPLLIKASMGRGGKGMRIVWKEADFLSALDSCRKESKSSFGDTQVILEKYLVHPRHIEFQIMADSYGNAVYLHERDFSLQRRHQKVIEKLQHQISPENYVSTWENIIRIYCYCLIIYGRMRHKS